MNFARDVVEAAPRAAARWSSSTAPARAASGRWARSPRPPRTLAAELHARGVRRGDVVLTLLGNRPEWVLTMVGLLPPGLRRAPVHGAAARRGPAPAARRSPGPELVVARRAQRATCSRRRLGRPDDLGALGRPAGARRAARRPSSAPDGSVPDRVHVRHGRRAEGRAPRSALPAPGSGCRRSTGSTRAPGELVWCTAASGWSKSARNAFIAPWLRGAAALLHDARFDPHERLELLERERVDVLCMAPTEYRVIAKRAEPRRGARPARRSSRPARRSTPACSAPGTRRPGCGSATATARPRPASSPGMPLGEPARPGSMGRPLPGIAARRRRRRARARPRDRPDVLPRLPRRATPHAGPWRTGDRVRADDDGYLYFEGRTDDVIISAGYRIGPFEVESALVGHPAVAEAAVVAAPDDERGSVVRAVVVLRDGYAPSPALARELQDHVKARDGALQVPAHRRLRGRAAAHGEREGPPRGAALTGWTAACVRHRARHGLRHPPGRQVRQPRADRHPGRGRGERAMVQPDADDRQRHVVRLGISRATSTGTATRRRTSSSSCSTASCTSTSRTATPSCSPAPGYTVPRGVGTDPRAAAHGHPQSSPPACSRRATQTRDNRTPARIA